MIPNYCAFAWVDKKEHKRNYYGDHAIIDNQTFVEVLTLYSTN